MQEFTEQFFDLILNLDSNWKAGFKSQMQLYD